MLWLLLLLLFAWEGVWDIDDKPSECLWCLEAHRSMASASTLLDVSATAIHLPFRS